MALAALVQAGSGLAGQLSLRTTGERTVSTSSTNSWKPYLLWAWMLTTFANFRVRSVVDLTAGDMFDGQVLFQVASWLCFGVIAAWAVLRGRANGSLVRRGPLAWYSGFIGLALISAAYSPLPELTAFTALQHAIALVLVISLGKRLHDLWPFVLMYMLVNWLLVILGALHMDFGLAWITPPELSQIWTDHEEWRFGTAFGHPSQLGIVAATAAFMLTSGPKKAVGRGFAAMLTLLTLLATISRTAIAGFAAALLFFAAKQRLVLVLCLSGSLCTLAILVEPSRDVILSYVARGQNADDIASLTGRVPVFEDAISRARVHWMFGQGFLSSRVLLLNDLGEGNGTVHPHNMFLAAITGMGIGGAVLALGSLISLFVAAARLLRLSHHYPSVRADAVSCASALLPLAAFCILDAGFVAKLNPFVLLYLTAAARTQDMLNSIESNLPERVAIGPRLPGGPPEIPALTC